MKRKWLLTLLLPFGMYALYLATGLVLLSANKIKRLTVMPGTVIRPSGMDRDQSKADIEGPHLVYTEGGITRRSIVLRNGRLQSETQTYPLSERQSIPVTCSFSGHPEWSFSTRLKAALSNEPAVYAPIQDIVAISDIEGNFEAFRRLLIAGKVMTADNRWQFGNGHLVLVGDFFDRGMYVTETLWLIYHLEEEAARAGGKVHFILGNHEIMNLQGDLRYMRNKYREAAALMKWNYDQWYSPQTELGRWLRTKNIAEQIGPFLFVHGGISQAVSRLNLPLDALNDLARPWYGSSRQSIQSDASGATQTLYHADHSPFWYRGLVTGEASESQITRVLQQYSASAMVVGHTMVPNISTLYDGSIVATDVDHADGTMQALRIKGNQLYRFDTSGMAVRL